MKFKKEFIHVLVAVFTVQLLGILTPLMMQLVVDKVLVHNSISTLNVLAVGIAIVYVYELILGLAKNYVFTHTTNRIDVILSYRLFKHLFALPLKYFESRKVGETVARVRELENIRNFLTGTPLSSIIDFLFIVVYIVVLFVYSKNLTLIVLASIPVYAVLSATAGTIGQFIQKVFDLLILYFGAKAVMDGNFTVGQLVAFRMLSGRVSGPVLRLVQLWQEYQQASLSVKRIGDIFNSPTEPVINTQHMSMPNMQDGIIGIVGRSGSGKSTISKLIQRLYIPEGGKITNDGTVAENISIHMPTASMEQIIAAAHRLSTLRDAEKITAINIENADIKINDTVAQYQTQINTKIAEIDQQLQEISANLGKTSIEKEYQQLKAPVKGYINSIEATTLGETVTSAQTLITIVPEKAPMEMVCYVQNRDIADIREKMDAEIKLDAYPYTTYGTIPSHVEYISPSAFVNEKLGSVYVVKLNIVNRNKNIKIIPGLSGNIELKMKKRSIMDYFLEPTKRGVGNSLKEK